MINCVSFLVAADAQMIWVSIVSSGEGLWMPIGSSVSVLHSISRYESLCNAHWTRFGPIMQ